MASYNRSNFNYLSLRVSNPVRYLAWCTVARTLNALSILLRAYCLKLRLGVVKQRMIDMCWFLALYVVLVAKNVEEKSGSVQICSRSDALLVSDQNGKFQIFWSRPKLAHIIFGQSTHWIFWFGSKKIFVWIRLESLKASIDSGTKCWLRFCERNLLTLSSELLEWNVLCACGRQKLKRSRSWFYSVVDQCCHTEVIDDLSSYMPEFMHT